MDTKCLVTVSWNGDFWEKGEMNDSVEGWGVGGKVFIIFNVSL